MTLSFSAALLLTSFCSMITGTIFVLLAPKRVADAGVLLVFVGFVMGLIAITDQESRRRSAPATSAAP